MSQAQLTGLSREQRISAVCAGACLLAAVALPLAVVAFWAFGSWPLLALVRLLPPDILADMEMGGAIRGWQRVAGAAICLVPAGLVSFGLLRARRSLAAFARGDFFSGEVVAGLRGYAAASFWAAVAGGVSVPVLSVIVSQGNPPGHREFSLDLSGAQLLGLLGAGILWVIASVMARASAIARENAEFV
jgi:hypothetical protein